MRTKLCTDSHDFATHNRIDRIIKHCSRRFQEFACPVPFVACLCNQRLIDAHIYHVDAIVPCACSLKGTFERCFRAVPLPARQCNLTRRAPHVLPQKAQRIELG